MQGRDEDSWKNLSTQQRRVSLNGTGKRPSPTQVPRRPPNVPRVDVSPTPRIVRPQQEASSPDNARRRWLVLGSLFLACALLACGFGYILFNYVNGLNASANVAVTTTDFLAALNNQEYDKAYQDLGVSITIQLTQNQFKQRALADDRCYGPVTNYTEVPDSATVQGNSQSYTYTITRTHLSKTYPLHLTLQQDREAPNNWKVTDYGGDLGPALPTCK